MSDAGQSAATVVSRKRTASHEGCAFWLEKKKRFCKTMPPGGVEYCGIHENQRKCEDISSNVTAVPVQTTESKGLGDEGVSGMTSEHAEVLQEKGGRPEPKPDRCNFWLERKRRYCQTRVTTDRLLCVEHSPMTNDETGRHRVPCPNDPKHSCYVDQLRSHLNRCNARTQLLPIYHVTGLNSGSGEVTDTEKTSLRDADIDEVFSVISRVKALHKDISPISHSVKFDETLRQEVDKPTNGVEAKRHLIQSASLVRNVRDLGLLKDDCHYVEFGAGKGGLSHWIQTANQSSTNCQYLLVDKSSVRYKMDCYHKGSEQGPNFERLKIDIENLSLENVPSLKAVHRSIVGIGKHLCGAATDLMLRCLTDKSIENKISESNKSKNGTENGISKSNNRTENDVSQSEKETGVGQSSKLTLSSDVELVEAKEVSSILTNQSSENSDIQLNNVADCDDKPSNHSLSKCETPSSSAEFYKRVDGITLALCCHHRCTWQCYVGKDWFLSHGLEPRHFSLIVSMSAWATCGTKHVTSSSAGEDGLEPSSTVDADDDDIHSQQVDYCHPRYGSLLPEQREQIGIQCKQLLDEGRLDYLRKHGFNARLIYYAERSDTLENMALVATKNI